MSTCPSINLDKPTMTHFGCPPPSINLDWLDPTESPRVALTARGAPFQHPGGGAKAVHVRRIVVLGAVWFRLISKVFHLTNQSPVYALKLYVAVQQETSINSCFVDLTVRMIVLVTVGIYVFFAQTICCNIGTSVDLHPNHDQHRGQKQTSLDTYRRTCLGHVLQKDANNQVTIMFYFDHLPPLSRQGYLHKLYRVRTSQANLCFAQRLLHLCPKLS